MEFTLLWAAATGIAMGWLALRLWPDNLPTRSFDRLIAAAIAGVVVGRLGAMVAQGINPITNPGDILIVRGGVLTGFASLAFTISLLWSTRGDRKALDALTPAVLFALSGWHAGCLWRAACLGTPSELPWAWAQAGSAVTRHPVEIYAAVILIAGAWMVSRLGWRHLLRAGVGMLVVAGARLFTEPLRPSITGGPTNWYLVGVTVGLLAIALGGRALTRSDHRAST